MHFLFLRFQKSQPLHHPRTHSLFSLAPGQAFKNGLLAFTLSITALTFSLLNIQWWQIVFLFFYPWRYLHAYCIVIQTFGTLHRWRFLRGKSEGGNWMDLRQERYSTTSYWWTHLFYSSVACCYLTSNRFLLVDLIRFDLWFLGTLYAFLFSMNSRWSWLRWSLRLGRESTSTFA